MPTDGDIDGAVADGILDADQAARLKAYLAARRGSDDMAPASSAADERDAEAVRFARGFHDIFLTIGILLLLVGIVMSGQVLLPGPVAPAIAAVTAWLLAEAFTARRRLVLPSIALAIGFVLSAGQILPAIIGTGRGGLADIGFEVIGFVAAATVASLAFYLRFRLPFAAGMIAVSATTLAVIVAEGFIGPSHAENLLALCVFIAGLATLSVAMAFDGADPDRETLKADNAFWLHLVAAPLIVHSLIQIVSGGAPFDIGLANALAIVGSIAILALLALVIDRRALLVAGLLYLGFAIARLIETTELNIGIVQSLTVLLLGIGVLLLGIGWKQARRAVVTLIVPPVLAAHLPPVAKT